MINYAKPKIAMKYIHKQYLIHFLIFGSINTRKMVNQMHDPLKGALTELELA